MKKAKIEGNVVMCPECKTEIKIEEIKVYTEKELGVILPVTPLGED